MKREILARILLLALCLVVVLIPLALRDRSLTLRARMPEDDGWSPQVIQAAAGQPLRLRLTSEDVTHGFAVGQMEMASVDVLPGVVSEVTLLFDEPGIYTFFCTRWCGLNHWRMRGTIEVSGGDAPALADAPLYVALGLDIDAPHPVPGVPSQIPSAARGGQLAEIVSLAEFSTPEYYRAHSPYQVYQDLVSTNLNAAERWDVVNYLWRSQTTAEGLAEGARLYAQNCAACHGETGGGDGVFADQLAASGQSSSQTMHGSMSARTPADFTDAQNMLGASPALLQGKLMRGGMGTGMPMWGVIFTEEQSWNIIAFLYSFQFQYQGVTR